MSYCRWSTDDYRCDLYAYEALDGWYIHVATHRIEGDIPRVPGFDALMDAGRSWSEAKSKQLEFIRRAARVVIDLPDAGAQFVEKDLAAFRKRLEGLRGVGYRFPDEVFDAVDMEMNGVLAA